MIVSPGIGPSLTSQPVIPAQYSQNWVPSRQYRISHEYVDAGSGACVVVAAVTTVVDFCDVAAHVDVSVGDMTLVTPLGEAYAVTVTVTAAVDMARGLAKIWCGGGRIAASGVGRRQERARKRIEESLDGAGQGRAKEETLPAMTIDL